VSAKKAAEKQENRVMALQDGGEEWVKAAGNKSEHNIASHSKDEERAHEGREP